MTLFNRKGRREIFSPALILVPLTKHWRITPACKFYLEPRSLAPSQTSPSLRMLVLLPSPRNQKAPSYATMSSSLETSFLALMVAATKIVGVGLFEVQQGSFQFSQIIARDAVVLSAARLQKACAATSAVSSPLMQSQKDITALSSRQVVGSALMDPSPCRGAGTHRQHRTSRARLATVRSYAAFLVLNAGTNTSSQNASIDVGVVFSPVRVSALIFPSLNARAMST